MCRAVKVREKLCTPDIELLCVSLHPYYLPREFPRSSSPWCTYTQRLILIKPLESFLVFLKNLRHSPLMRLSLFLEILIIALSKSLWALTTNMLTATPGGKRHWTYAVEPSRMHSRQPLFLHLEHLTTTWSISARPIGGCLRGRSLRLRLLKCGTMKAPWHCRVVLTAHYGKSSTPLISTIRSRQCLIILTFVWILCCPPGHSKSILTISPGLQQIKKAYYSEKGSSQKPG